MSKHRLFARLAVVALATATAGIVAIPAAQANSTSTAQWSTATTNNGTYSDFDEGTVTFGTPVDNATHVHIVSTGYGHSHGGTVTLSVQVLPSGTTVWSTTVDSSASASMNVDAFFGVQTQVTGVRITSSPFQSQSYHSFSGTDLVTVDTATVQCQDGIDNDADGKVDYPNDPGCSSPTDVTEAPNPACSDGLDNDGDGLVDYPNDPGCSGVRDDSEGVACSTTAGITTCLGITAGSEIQRIRVYSVAPSGGPTHTIAGFIDVYQYKLPNNTTVNLPCVVLAGETPFNRCTAAGGTFVTRAATLVNQTISEPTQGPEVTNAGICNAELVATVNDIGLASFPVYTLC